MSEAVLARLRARTVESGDCWLWTGYTKNGYGALSVGNVDRYIHRLSFEIHHGPVPEGQEVCHRCDVPTCWAPHHLFAGTHAENVADCVAKGRAFPLPHHRGERNPKAHLTDAEVAALRALADTMPQREIAARFGVSQSTVWRLLRGVVRT